MTFATAEDRCNGEGLCVFGAVVISPRNDWFRKGYHWTSKDCGINVKVNSEGYIAIVHDVESSYVGNIPYHVEEANTLNWFRVFWDGSGDYPGNSEANSCSANNCKTMDDNSCLCKTSVTENAVFNDIASISKADVLSQLFIGTTGPQNGSVPSTGNQFTAHILGGVVDKSTVFEVEDKGKTFFLKNLRSTVSLRGWEMTPEIYEAEDATVYNSVIMSNTGSATGGLYVHYGIEQSYVEWNVVVDNPGKYLIAFRYALDSSPTPLSIFLNSVEVPPKSPANPSIPIVNQGYTGTPPPEAFPLQRCEGDCDRDSDCADGLICKRNDAFEEVPGCSNTGAQKSSYDYCMDPADFAYAAVFYPTGGWTDDWQYTDPIEVTLSAGPNVVRVKTPDGYNIGPNIDHMKIEGFTSSTSTSSFRNPPHFLSLIPDYFWPFGLGEQTLRDAQYETDAVLDHYFYQDNVAPFLCTRIIQRFGISNPSPRYVSECSKAFKTGLYSSGSKAFGSGQYGCLEAVAAAIILDKEATVGAITSDPSYGSLGEPILKVLAVMRSLEYQTKIPDTLVGPPMHNDYQVRLKSMDQKIGQGPYEFPTVFSFFFAEYVPDVGPALPASLVSPESMLITMPNTIALLNGMFSIIKYGLSDCNEGFSTYPGYAGCIDNGRYERSYGRLSYEPEGVSVSEQITDLALLLTAGRLSKENHATIEQACSSEPDRASIIRCIQQLIITTGEFHSTNLVIQSGEERATATNGGSSSESYKAIIYLYLGGGCDSFNMLAPYTCSPVDVYERYRAIRGKNDIAEGVGLPKERLLEIQSNNAEQPCSSFGIHEELTVLKRLYDQQELNFVANAGLLAKPVDVSNYNGETPVRLFAHNTMAWQASRDDLAEEYSGTGEFSYHTSKRHFLFFNLLIKKISFYYM